jgi:hypothetical protein
MNSDTVWGVIQDAFAYMVVAFGFSVPLFLALAAVYANFRNRSVEIVGMRTLVYMGYAAPINLIFRLLCNIAHIEAWPGSDVLAGPLGVAVVIALDIVGWIVFMKYEDKPVKTVKPPE